MGNFFDLYEVEAMGNLFFLSEEEKPQALKLAGRPIRALWKNCPELEHFVSGDDFVPLLYGLTDEASIAKIKPLTCSLGASDLKQVREMIQRLDDKSYRDILISTKYKMIFREELIA